jgi:hypothetical protein
MSFKKVFLAVVVLTVLAYGGYVYKDRFWETQKTQTKEETRPEFNKSSKDPSSLDQAPTNPDNSGDLPKETTPEETETQTEAVLEDYLKDCDNKCESFFGAQLDRCLEICRIKGSSPEEDGSIESCESKTGEEKDFCLKNQAVKEKKESLCKEISNQAVREACFNAVAETILDR